MNSSLPYKLLIFDWEGTLAEPNALYHSQLFPGTHEALTLLKEQGYLLAVATAKSKQGLAADLLRLDLQHLMSATCTAQESEPKPNPAMLFNILDKLAIVGTDALMIGDTSFDLMMAKQAHLSAVAVSSGVQTAEELLQYNPLVCLDNVTQLPQWLTHRKR